MRKIIQTPDGWEYWFAWYPVKIVKKSITYRVWWETILRKESYGSGWLYKFTDDMR